MSHLTDAANILEVSEYEVMRRAYRYWHGREAPAAVLGEAFSVYLREGTVPHWARHYAAHVVTSFEDELDRGCACLRLLWLLLASGRPRGGRGRACLAA